MLVELLAPGGNYDSVIAALNAGADAVYTAGNMFGARANAQNLSEDELIDAINYAHLFDKKIYLTVNTLLKDDELKLKLYEYLLPLYENGLDAVIVQDIGVMLFIRKYFPLLHIHASTQMIISGKYTVKWLENQGVTRIVTPRELSLSEIKEIHKNSSVEIESFVHGALCYCYSGQCLMSSFIGGRSGNRGQCAQPCRMEYNVLKNKKCINQGNNKYVLSPKDICTLDILPEIVESGVYSLKIEGRMKKPEYVSGVVSIYRKYIDLYENNRKKYKVEEKDLKLLADLFNRNGFSQSYYKQHNGKNMISLKKPAFRMENTDFTNYLQNQFIGKTMKYPLNIKIEIKKDLPISISANINDEKIELEGQLPYIAEKKPISIDDIKKQISKLGGTYFVAESIEVVLDDGLFIPMGYLNQLRRDFIGLVQNTINTKYLRKAEENCSINDNNIEISNIKYNSDKEENIDYNIENNQNKYEQKYNQKDTENKHDLKVNVLVSTTNQLMTVIDFDRIDTVFVEEFALDKNTITEFINKVHSKNKKIFLAMPYVFRMNDAHIFEKKYSGILQLIDGFLIRNLEEYFYLKEIKVEKNFIFDYNVYAYNSVTKEFYNENDIVTTVPLELNYKELKKRGCKNEEFIVYGNIPIMTTANCLINTCSGCNKKSETVVLEDRLHNDFKTKCVCDYCYNIIYNCKPLSLLNYIKDIENLDVSYLRLNFTFENETDVKEITKYYLDALNLKNEIIDKTDSTRGHFKRGVL